VAGSAVRAGGVAISSPEFEARMREEEAMSMISGGESGKDDDGYDVAESGTRKKGTAKRKSRRERQAQRRLSKL